jgi:hypothetical protein
VEEGLHRCVQGFCLEAHAARELTSGRDWFAGMTGLVIIMSAKEMLMGEHHEEHDAPKPAYMHVRPSPPRVPQAK